MGLEKQQRQELFKDNWGFLRNISVLTGSTGLEATHILTDIHPPVPVSGFVKDIKLSSNLIDLMTGILSKRVIVIDPFS